MDNASPQLENGYTRLANEILDALLLAGLTSRQWAVVMAVIRKTYGYNKKSDDIGLSQLQAMTRIDKAHLSRTVRELEAMRVLSRTVGTHGHHLGLNKKIAQWGLLIQQPQLPKQQPLLKEQPGVAESATLGVAESAIRGLPKQQPQKTRLKDKVKTTPKDMSAGALAERFEKFYSIYPKKRNRADAEKAFAKLNPDDSLLSVIVEAVEVAKRSRDDWRRDGGKYIPYPASWLNAKGWTDEPDQIAYTAAELAVIETYNRQMPAAWPRGISDPFSATRASAIREFLGFAPEKPDMPRRYFEHCAQNLTVIEHCGFDWLIRRETYLRVREGAVKHKEPA
ncbi:replication protein [Paraburkholderia sp.]|uniref:replication protein n=1 Tax=Paraburkholderia sp. TaxID=1926495 RepID=UPI003C7B80AF